MARLKHQLFSVSRRHVTEEIAYLKQVGRRPMPGTIPEEHRNRLMKAGYIREVARPRRSALVLTGRGLARLALDK